MKPSSTGVALKWAVIYLLISIVITYLFQFLNVDQTGGVKWLGFIPLIVFLFLAQKEYKDQLGGYISYGDAFLPGLFFSLFAGIFGAIFSYLYFAILNPAEFERILTTTQTQMEAKGSSPDQIEAAIGFMRKGGVFLITVGSAVTVIVLGIIISLITAAILKKERSPLEIAEANQGQQL